MRKFTHLRIYAIYAVYAVYAFTLFTHLREVKRNGIRSRWSLNGNEWHSLVTLAEWQSACY